MFRLNFGIPEFNIRIEGPTQIRCKTTLKNLTVTSDAFFAGITLIFDIKMLMFIRARSKIGPVQLSKWGNEKDEPDIPLRTPNDVINATIPIQERVLSFELFKPF